MMLKHMYIYLQQVNNEHKYLMLRISERGSLRVNSRRHGKNLSSIEMETVKMIMTTAAAT